MVRRTGRGATACWPWSSVCSMGGIPMIVIGGSIDRSRAVYLRPTKSIGSIDSCIRIGAWHGHTQVHIQAKEGKKAGDPAPRKYLGIGDDDEGPASGSGARSRDRASLRNRRLKIGLCPMGRTAQHPVASLGVRVGVYCHKPAFQSIFVLEFLSPIQPWRSILVLTASLEARIDRGPRSRAVGPSPFHS